MSEENEIKVGLFLNCIYCWQCENWSAAYRICHTWKTFYFCIITNLLYSDKHGKPRVWTLKASLKSGSLGPWEEETLAVSQTVPAEEARSSLTLNSKHRAALCDCHQIKTHQTSWLEPDELWLIQHAGKRPHWYELMPDCIFLIRVQLSIDSIYSITKTGPKHRQSWI